MLCLSASLICLPSNPSPIESYYFIHPFLLSSHTKLEFRHVISLSSSSVTTIKSQNLIHTHFLIPSIVLVISLVLKLSSWIETYLKTEGCQLKLAPLQIAKNPVGKQNKRNSGLLAVPVPILHISYNAESFWDSLIVFCLDPH